MQPGIAGVIGEIGSRNPNVYYEIALAHCAERPSVLLTSQDKVDSIPFDLRHHRVITYDSKEPATLVDPLSQALTYLKDAVLEHQIQPTLEDHLLSLSGGNEHHSLVALDIIVKQVGKEFELSNPRLEEWEALENGGFLITHLTR